ncbi:MAG TPA: hypothetical protein VGE97_09335 [Nitrososphaera sp.]|jgi:hypothetical protein
MIDLEDQVITGRRWRSILDELIDHERTMRNATLGPWERWKYLEKLPERTKRLILKGQQNPELVMLNGLVAPEGQPSGPPTSFTAVNTTNVETNLWVPAIWTPIPANSMTSGKLYQGNAGGVLGTSSAAPTATWTPRCGQSVTPSSNITLGATTGTTMIASLSAVPWTWQFTLNIRNIGLAASGATGTGNGYIVIGGLTTAAGIVQSMGGTVATTIDSTAATGLILSNTWGTNAATNTVTCQWTAPVLSLN